MKSSSTFIRKLKNRNKNEISLNESIDIEKEKNANKSTIKRNVTQKNEQEDSSMLDMLHKLDNATTDLRE